MILLALSTLSLIHIFHSNMAMIKIKFIMLGPIIAASAIATTKKGKHIITSVIRIIRLSTLPP